MGTDTLTVFGPTGRATLPCSVTYDLECAVKKGRHRRYEEARALKRGSDLDIESIFSDLTSERAEGVVADIGIDDDESDDEDDFDYDDELEDEELGRY